ncbi:MAG: DUF4097 family beta strand repeat protein [Alteromonadaceae bacterium]|nr:DUF4097 family beta strand repeat protein [Alteromonadaceae bacterium]
MKLLTSITALSTVCLLSGCVIAINPAKADVHIKKELTLSAQQLQKLTITTGAGLLVINGENNTDSIKVIADIYSDNDNLDNVQLSLTENHNQANLIAKMDVSHGFWQGNSPHIDIKISLPHNLSLNINDGSGDIDITNIGADINLTDGSGNIELASINGNLTIDDGSGDIQLKAIQGNVDINDGSGGLYVKNIQGNMKIIDGSGDIGIKHIRGNVNINDNSGSIAAKDIQGNIDIVDGSGDLSVKNVTKKVTINDGSGDINVKNIGQLNISESGSGGVYLDNISAK